jgi:hypothetical protein
LPRAFDLHVLGLPPAFALSQDQTLKLDENFSRPITTFDEVPPASCGCDGARDLHRAHDRRRHEIGVDLKRRPPKSRPAAARSRSMPLARQNLDRTSRRAGTPPSTFLFLPIHLSNSPGPRRSHSPANRRAVENRGVRLGSEAWSPTVSEELRRHAVAPRRRRAELTQYIGFRPPKCQHPKGLGTGAGPGPSGPGGNRRVCQQYRGFRAGGKAVGAVLAPLSSAPLVDAVGGVTSGGAASASRDPRRTASPND